MNNENENFSARGGTCLRNGVDQHWRDGSDNWADQRAGNPEGRCQDCRSNILDFAFV